MQNSLQNTLKDFYSVVLLGHGQTYEKIQDLDNYFSKNQASGEVKYEVLKQNREVQYQTLASIGDMDHFSNNSPRTTSFCSRMLYTFLLSNQSNRKDPSKSQCSKIISKLSFTDFSFFKVFLYAIFINFLHINKQVGHSENNAHLNHCLSFAEQTLKKVKVAMVSAALSFKSSNKKKYNKIRYLYDQLISYTEKNCSLKEQYLKVIIQEFDDDFIQKTFDNLKLKCNQLLYSRSVCSSLSLEETFTKEDEMLLDIEMALEYLKVRLTLLKEEKEMEIGDSGEDLNIVIEQMPNCAFKLREIISTPSSAELSQA